MKRAFKAVIFDMDGVIVDSEPLWRRAMIKGFTEVGIDFTEDDCRKTQGTRFKEVVEMWLKFHQVESISASLLENRIMSYLLDLVDLEGEAMPGVKEVINFCQSYGLKLGLATSSDNILMNKVLAKLDLKKDFDVICSAEFMKYGKPHPEVFLQCAENLNVNASSCLVIEDSVNGVIAAKAAQMCVIAIPDADHQGLQQFMAADYKLNHSSELIALFKNLFP